MLALYEICLRTPLQVWNYILQKTAILAYIYMFKTFPTFLMFYRLCVCVTIIGTASWTALLLWRQVMWGARGDAM